MSVANQAYQRLNQLIKKQNMDNKNSIACDALKYSLNSSVKAFAEIDEKNACAYLSQDSDGNTIFCYNVRVVRIK